MSLRNWLVGLAGWSAAFLVCGFMVEQSHAQQQCGPRADLVKALGDRYSESPVAAGLIDATSILEIFSRIDGDSWTAVISKADGTSCLLMPGKAWVKVPYKATGPRT